MRSRGKASDVASSDLESEEQGARRSIPTPSALLHLSTFWETCSRDSCIEPRKKDIDEDMQGRKERKAGGIQVMIQVAIWGINYLHTHKHYSNRPKSNATRTPR